MLDDDLPPPTEAWREAFRATLEALPDDMPQWARVMVEVQLRGMHFLVKHTDNNTRTALQEQDERLKDTISDTESRLTTRMDRIEEANGRLEQAVIRQDRGFSVLETLIEQTNQRLLWTLRGLVGLALFVILEVLIYLTPRIALRPSDLWWLGLVSAGALGGWLGAALWKRRARTRGRR